MDLAAEVLPLHEHPQYLKECCHLLNSQWPRSETARLRSLQASCANLPASLILVDLADRSVIGHAKISSLPNGPHGCFIESVVVRPSFRGKGYGKLLMLKCEEYVVKKGFRTAFLSTHDQQVFYGKLGYQLCRPVCHFGGTVKSKTALLVTKPSKRDDAKTASLPPNETKLSGGPPPPPLPQPSLTNASSDVKVYMKKDLIIN